MLSTQPICAQEDERVILDLTFPPNDLLVEKDYKDQADAARIAEEIVVCRSLGEETDGVWDRKDFEKRYAERTQGIKSKDFIEGCHDQGWPPVCVRIGAVEPPPLIIDIEALPEPPPGSDAERIANGLPPLKP